MPDSPTNRALRGAEWCLRLAVAVQCVGEARLALTVGTPVFSLLWGSADVGGFGLSESLALSVEHTAAWLLIAAAALTLWRPCWPVLVPVAFWFLLDAGSSTWIGGSFLSSLSVPAHATRIVAPLALALIALWPSRPELPRWRLDSGLWLLRLAAAATFIAHGYEAVQLHPLFVDYLIAAAATFFSYDLAQPTAELLLRGIGIIDFILAALLVTTRWRAVAYYMAFWGVVTALSRIVYGGWNDAPQAFVRAANAGVPLALAVYWTLSHRMIPHASTPAQQVRHEPCESTVSRDTP